MMLIQRPTGKKCNMNKRMYDIVSINYFKLMCTNYELILNYVKTYK